MATGRQLCTHAEPSLIRNWSNEICNELLQPGKCDLMQRAWYSKPGDASLMRQLSIAMQTETQQLDRQLHKTPTPLPLPPSSNQPTWVERIVIQLSFRSSAGPQEANSGSQVILCNDRRSSSALPDFFASAFPQGRSWGYGRVLSQWGQQQKPNFALSTIRIPNHRQVQMTRMQGRH